MDFMNNIGVEMWMSKIFAISKIQSPHICDKIIFLMELISTFTVVTKIYFKRGFQRFFAVLDTFMFFSINFPKIDFYAKKIRLDFFLGLKLHLVGLVP